MPPDQALAGAAQRINAILAEEGALARQPATPPAETPNDPREIVLWFYTHPLMAPMLSGAESLAGFSAAHPNVKLKRQFTGDWHVAIQKLTVSLAAGDLPDIALVKRAWLARLAPSGRIARLDSLLPASLIEDLRGPSREALTVNGHLYAFPADGFCSVLFYNRELVPGRPPRTWQELERIARDVSRPNDDPRQALYGLGDLPFIEALWSAGGNVCDEIACGLDSREAREALDFVLSLRNDNLAHPRGLGDPERAFELFLAGRVAMTVAGSSRLPRARNAPFPVGVAPVPGKTGPISMMSDNAIVVFARYAQAKRRAIAEALDFLTGPQVQGAAALALGSAPVRASVANKLPVTAGLDQAYLHAANTPLVGPWGAIEFELSRSLYLAYRWRPSQK